ncbi:MAG: hypothetical protein ACXW15_11930 [Acidimicrobiia bacterium]
MVKSKPGSSPSFTLIAEPREKPDVQQFAEALIAFTLDQMEREEKGKLSGPPRATQLPITPLPPPKRTDDQAGS